VFLEALPLSPSGKIDRRALPPADSERPALDTAYVPPGSPTEKQLVGIWREVLGLDDVGIHDDFFDLGGSSMRSLQLWRQIERTFELQIDLNLVTRHRTIAGMAGALGQVDVTAGPGVGRSPAGQLPDADSLVLFTFGYAPTLASHLDDVPIYPLDLPEDDDDFETIEDLAVASIRSMRGRQRNGPYWLCGHCFYGLVAFEMARKLHEVGEEVPLVIMIDTPPLDRYGRLWNYDTRYFASRAIHHLVRVGKMSPKLWPQYIRAKLLGAYRAATTQKATATRKPLEPRNQLDVPTRLLQATRAYRPRSFAGRVTHLVAGGEPGMKFYRDHESGWNQVALGGVEMRMIPGEHLAIFEEPNVRVMAQELRAALSAARSKEERARGGGGGD
jgi:aspartate racemase